MLGVSTRLGRLEALERERCRAEVNAKTDEELDALIGDPSYGERLRAMGDDELNGFIGYLEAGGDPARWEGTA